MIKLGSVYHDESVFFYYIADPSFDCEWPLESFESDTGEL